MNSDKSLDPSSGLAVFTDGSAYPKDRSGGWAWVAVDAWGGTETDAGPVSDTTISQMELLAVTEALASLFEACGPCEVLVHSDSEYVVLGCNDKSRKRLKNVKWWDNLDHMIKLHQYVAFEHVRGHQDNEYNNLADELAGRARRDGVCSRL